MQELHHELTLQLLSHSTAAAGVMLAGAHLSPEVSAIRAFLDTAIDGSDVSPAYIVSPIPGLLALFEFLRPVDVSTDPLQTWYA